MKYYYKKAILSLMTILLFTSCSKINFQTYKQNPAIHDTTSVVLLGIQGNKTVNYLQFMSSSKFPPAFNYRGISVTNDIIALRVPTPQKNYYFGVFTAGKAGYITYGNMHSSYGYINAESKGINIDKQGIYFYGILNTDSATIDQSVNKEFLNFAKQKYKNTFKDLKPINFEW